MALADVIAGRKRPFLDYFGRSHIRHLYKTMIRDYHYQHYCQLYLYYCIFLFIIIGPAT